MTTDVCDEEAKAVEHVESRIKLWVVSGLVTNMLAMLMVTIPMIYYLGSISAQFERLARDSESQAAVVRDLELWRQRVDAQAEYQGFADDRGK